MTTDPLAALLLEHLIGPGGRCACGTFVADGDHRRTAIHIAARLRAAGVTTPAQPAEGPGTLSCPVCGDDDTRSLIVAAAARNIFSGFDLKLALAQPAPDPLREAAQAVVDAIEARDIVDPVIEWREWNRRVAALRAALEGDQA